MYYSDDIYSVVHWENNLEERQHNVKRKDGSAWSDRKYRGI